MSGHRRPHTTKYTVLSFCPEYVPIMGHRGLGKQGDPHNRLLYSFKLQLECAGKHKSYPLRHVVGEGKFAHRGWRKKTKRSTLMGTAC